MMNLLSFIFGLLFSIATLPTIINMLKTDKSIENNYRGVKIPISVGIVFIYSQLLTIFAITILTDRLENIILSYMLSLVFMGMIGLLDDLVGNKRVKGFKGHIMLIFNGQLSTGGLKALTGLLISLMFSKLLSGGSLKLIINALIIVLFTNAINLFDLRPGRGCKVFILFGIILLMLSNNDTYDYILYSAFGFCVAFLPFDLREKAMMGDVGSNSLGITLGIYCAITNKFSYKILYLFILIIIHFVGEKYSLTKMISKNRFLSFIDKLGRY